ncbi:hypothetical protein J41TS12_17650 [Paenibacillus antibioticophila]|uniref:Uncharacterized protein n=1 Tax=Paenibacillus antibioticophila TaxID=1274374 RepID=A0A919XQ28_9BACL|nr:hypothetical protein J41TS12_17650 [Paenibacillus antibioticophila]
MHKKKYFTLLPPFLLLTIILAFTLPSEKRFYAFFAIIAFWISYYAWIYIERKRKND